MRLQEADADATPLVPVQPRSEAKQKELDALGWFMTGRVLQIRNDRKQALEASARFKEKIATQVLPAGPFWVAEDYHQDYYKKNPHRYQYYKTACGRAARLEQLWGPPKPPQTMTQ